MARVIEPSVIWGVPLRIGLSGVPVIENAPSSVPARLMRSLLKKGFARYRGNALKEASMSRVPFLPRE